MNIIYKPERGKRWIPYYIGEQRKPASYGADNYTTLVHCPCCGGSRIVHTVPTGMPYKEGCFDINCLDCDKKIGVLRDWNYSPFAMTGIWTESELDDYRTYITMGKMDEIKEDFGFGTDDGMKIRKSKSGKYIVVEGIV